MDFTVGGKLLRVWQLGFRTDFGLPGMCDPFDMTVLMELVLSEGLPELIILSFFDVCQTPVSQQLLPVRFRTNPNDPGTEKLAIWPITDAWLQDKYKPLPPLNPADEEDGPPLNHPIPMSLYISS